MPMGAVFNVYQVNFSIILYSNAKHVRLAVKHVRI